MGEGQRASGGCGAAHAAALDHQTEAPAVGGVAAGEVAERSVADRIDHPIGICAVETPRVGPGGKDRTRTGVHRGCLTHRWPLCGSTLTPCRSMTIPRPIPTMAR